MRARKVRRRPLHVALVLPGLSLLLSGLCALGAGCGRSGPAAEAAPIRVRLATTTSARDTGLLEWLKPELRRVARVELQDVAVGTGQALKLGQSGDADLVIVHDRAREDAWVAAGWALARVDLMWNDFVLLGPASDPAGVRAQASAAAALGKIAAAGATFVSRGDDSGTHAREKSLWVAAGGRPGWADYLESGQGQGPTLLIADEKRAYVLSDRGTYAAMRSKLALALLVQGDPALRNPYGAMCVNPAKVPGVNAAGAQAVVDYLRSPEGQARIASFEVAGERLFHPGAPAALAK